MLPFFFLLVFIILSIQLCFVSQQHLDLFFAFCLPVFPSCVFDFFVLLSSCHFLYSWFFSIHSVSLANSIRDKRPGSPSLLLMISFFLFAILWITTAFFRLSSSCIHLIFVWFLTSFRLFFVCFPTACS